MTETHFDANAALKLGQDVLSHEADAILAASRRIGETPDFAQAVKAILGCRGRLVVSGVGKSGHIGRKLAATFASTGTPAFFVHAGEAAHGDLGMITSEDIVLGISYSGETQELLMIVPILKREGAILIAMTGNPESTLAQHADLHINCHVDREACPLNLAPSISTTRSLALGLHVRDIMRTGDELPRVTADVRVLDAVREITKKHIGMTAVVDSDNRVIGIFTEGDLRRLIERMGDVRDVIMRDVMTPSPHTISPDELAAAAVKALEAFQCNQLLVVDADNHLVGALHMHDLMNARVL